MAFLPWSKIRRLMRMKFALSSLFVCITGSAFAAPINDFYIQQASERYFALPQDARGIALAGSLLANCSDSSCVFQNPAGLGFLVEDELGGSISRSSSNGYEFLEGNPIEQSIKNGYLTVAAPLSVRDGYAHGGTLSFAFSRYQGSTNDSLQTAPDGHRRTIAYGYSPAEGLAFGYSFTFFDDQLQSRVADLHAHARFLHLFGAQFRASEDTSYGLALRGGVGQSDTEDYLLESDGLSKPREFGLSLGVRTRMMHVTPSASFDFAHQDVDGNLKSWSPGVVIGGDEEGDWYHWSAGLEMPLQSNLIARAGVRYTYARYVFKRADLRALSGSISAFTWSAGLGYVFSELGLDEEGVCLDYGMHYAAQGRGGFEHRVNLSVPF